MIILLSRFQFITEFMEKQNPLFKFFTSFFGAFSCQLMDWLQPVNWIGFVTIQFKRKFEIIGHQMSSTFALF